MFEETANLSTSQQIGPKQTPTISTRDESQDSWFEEKTDLSTTSQPIRPNQLTTISTRDESKDSLLEETAFGTSIPPNLAQMKIKRKIKRVPLKSLRTL